MKTVAQFVEENMDDIKKLQKIGIVGCKLLIRYSIYSHFKSLNSKDIPDKMVRYSFTADAMQISEKSVMRAVKEMEMAMN